MSGWGVSKLICINGLHCIGYKSGRCKRVVKALTARNAKVLQDPVEPKFYVAGHGFSNADVVIFNVDAKRLGETVKDLHLHCSNS